MNCFYSLICCRVQVESLGEEFVTASEEACLTYVP